MPEALTAVAALFTIWAQSSILAENGEFQRFKEEPAPKTIYEGKPRNQIEEGERRRQEILTAAIERKQYILSQTTLR